MEDAFFSKHTEKYIKKVWKMFFKKSVFSGHKKRDYDQNFHRVDGCTIAQKRKRIGRDMCVRTYINRNTLNIQNDDDKKKGEKKNTIGIVVIIF